MRCKGNKIYRYNLELFKKNDVFCTICSILSNINICFMINRIAIFASGSGSNAENIINFFAQDSRFLFPIIISNKEDAYIHTRVKNLGVPSVTFSKEQFLDGSDILSLLSVHNINAIVLAGFLLKVPDGIIRAYSDKIINIHPALLPKFGGKGMYGNHVHKAVVAAKEAESGITIHYVNEHYDEGNIIFQAKCEVLPTDTFEDLAHKIHALEYEHFPKVIETLWG